MSAATRIRWVLALTTALLLALTPVANAYVDPGSTSLIFSWIVAGLAAAGMTLRIFWSRVRGLFSSDEGPATTTEGTDDSTEPSQPTKVGADTE